MRRRRTSALRPRRSGDYDDVCCENCGSGGRTEELLLCDGCDRGFHLFCLKPILARVPSGQWFCPSCTSPSKIKEFPLIQTKIVDFFHIRRQSGSDSLKPLGEIQKPRRKKPLTLVASKKKRRLQAFQPTQDSARRLQQMASLATALTTVGATFCNKLSYSSTCALRSANRASHEREEMQMLHKDDVETLRKCNEMISRGECPPLMVLFDPLEGFTVVADRFIKDLTIISEYVGDVDYLRNREHYDGDSMMTLLSASDPSKSLVICPDKKANISRFINGINNHTPGGKRKQNLKCVRFDVDGECRVLLIAIRAIAKGERLYYDYNGSEHEYPTHHFV